MAQHKGSACRVHRLVYELFHGHKPGKLLVCHSCDVPLCIEPRHLWLGTAKDNTQDAVRKGRLGGHVMPLGHAAGEKNPNRKLDSAKVTEIRKLYATGLYGQTELGKMFGVTQSQIWHVVVRRAWKNVA